MQFRPPPAWLLKYGNPGPFIRPEMRKGLVGLWLPHVGHGGNTLWDVSGRGNHGVFPGGANNPTPLMGTVGSTLDFDGGDYVEVHDDNFYDLCGGTGDGYSVILLVHSDTTDARRTIIGDWDSSGLKETLAVEFGGHNVSNNHWSCNQRGSGRSGVVLDTNVSYSADTWYSVAVTFDGTTRRMYADGHELKNDTPLGGWQREENSGNATIGRAGEYDGLYMDGGLARFALYNRGLSQGDVLALSEDFWGTMFRQPTAAEWVKAAAAAGLSPAVAAYYYRMMRTGGC